MTLGPLSLWPQEGSFWPLLSLYTEDPSLCLHGYFLMTEKSLSALNVFIQKKKKKGKWTGVKGVLISREWWENIFLSGYEEYSNTLVCEHLANVTHVCYLMGPIDIWVCELWSVVPQLQISERLWGTWQDDLSPHRWVLFSLSLRCASAGQPTLTPPATDFPHISSGGAYVSRVPVKNGKKLTFIEC